MALSGGKTSSETIDWITLIAETEGQEYTFVEHDTYEITRKIYQEDDKAGVYNSNPN